MAIKIKDHKVLRSILSVPYHTVLIDIILWIVCRYSEAIITDGYRKDDGGVHGTIPCRGIDLRSTIFGNPESIKDDINAHWQYDPDRPDMRVCVYHAVCPVCNHNNLGPFHDKCEVCGEYIKDHWHFHIQSHLNTKRRE